MSFEDQIREIAREEIARALGASSMAYSTARSDLYPPGCDDDRRRARDRIRAVPGHQRIGKGRATVWSVARELYHQHHGRAPLRLVATSSDEEIAERALRGTRATRAS